MPDDSNVSQTPLWITLGVLYGILFSLSADHYVRAQKKAHIFVRASMLGLSCGVFLSSAASVAYICYWIRIQDLNLDGLERVYSVLIPVVVRGDLLIDWGKRVVWLLFLAPTWTQSCVSLRRILRRAADFDGLVALDESVFTIARGEGVAEGDFTGDCVAAENDVWADGAESLFKINQILDYMLRIARVAVYALLGLVGAIPAALSWVAYAVYKGAVNWGDGYRRLAIAYWFSMLLAPVTAVVCMFVSGFAFVGIVGLSVIGACVAFSVHWSMRIVYTMVRMALSQAWADFPFVMRRDGAVAALKKNKDKLEKHVIELPGVIGKTVVELPARVKKEVRDFPGHFGSSTNKSQSKASEVIPTPAYRVYAAPSEDDIDPSVPPPVNDLSASLSGEDRVVGATAGSGPALTAESAEEGRATTEAVLGLGQTDGLHIFSELDRRRRASGPAPAAGRRGIPLRKKRLGNRTSSFPAGGLRGRLRGGADRTSDREESDSSSSDDDVIGLYHGMVLERHPDEAGAAIARLGFLLPTELEFALASWDGTATRRGEISAFPTTAATTGQSGHSSGSFVIDGVKGVHRAAGKAGAPEAESMPQPSLSHRSSNRTSRGIRGQRARERRELRYMVRLGMDSQVDSAPKRRLTVYYCLAMIAQLQVASGGNSWQIRKKLLHIPVATKVKDFIATIADMQSIVACEAAEACIELSDRLHQTAKYRTVPAGGRNVEVGTWLRALLLVLLADPQKPPTWMPSIDDYDSAFLDFLSAESFSLRTTSKEHLDLPVELATSDNDGAGKEMKEREAKEGADVKKENKEGEEGHSDAECGEAKIVASTRVSRTSSVEVDGEVAQMKPAFSSPFSSLESHNYSRR